MQCNYRHGSAMPTTTTQCIFKQCSSSGVLPPSARESSHASPTLELFACASSILLLFHRYCGFGKHACLYSTVPLSWRGRSSSSVSYACTPYAPSRRRRGGPNLTGSRGELQTVILHQQPLDVAAQMLFAASAEGSWGYLSTNLCECTDVYRCMSTRAVLGNVLLLSIRPTSFWRV